MKRKFLAVTLCLVLTASITCCTKAKSSSNSSNDNTTDNNLLINDTSSLDDESSKDETTDTVTTSKKEASSDIASTNASSSSVTSNKNCRLFFYDSVDGRNYYVDTTVTVTDNAYVSALTEALQTTAYSDEFVLLTNEIGVKSAILNYEDNSLTVKFNYSFKNYMNLNSDEVSGLLFSLVNTYGYNYGADKVAIYFGEEPFIGVAGYDENGFYTVSTDSAISFNKN